jgi:hypothetical protein
LIAGIPQIQNDIGAAVRVELAANEAAPGDLEFIHLNPITSAQPPGSCSKAHEQSNRRREPKFDDSIR